MAVDGTTNREAAASLFGICQSTVEHVPPRSVLVVGAAR